LKTLEGRGKRALTEAQRHGGRRSGGEREVAGLRIRSQQAWFERKEEGSHGGTEARWKKERGALNLEKNGLVSGLIF
jgi:hypothetical protein